MFNTLRLTTWVAVILLVLQFGVLTVSAFIGCAAEANFQACKSIERLIQQCYNLCPEYSIDAKEQARIATSICAAVPTPSIAPLPSMSRIGSSAVSPTWVAPTTTGSNSAPSASQSSKSSFAIHLTPAMGFMCTILILGMTMTQL